MILSTQNDYLNRKLGIERSTEILKNAGFDAIDYSFFGLVSSDHPLNSERYMFEVEKIQNAAEKYGIGYNQAHAPFTNSWTLDNIDEWLHKVVRSIEIASVLGAKNIVVHPIHHLDHAIYKDELRRINMDFYRRLIPFCEKYSICVCLENMWQRDPVKGNITVDTCSLAEEFASYLDELDSPHLVGCLDLGHCGLTGEEAADAIRYLGNRRLLALHVHDNDYISDCHTLPYHGKMKWDDITAALADIDYKGDFTFEADHFLEGYDLGLLPEASAHMEKVGRFLISKIMSAR